MQKCLVHHVGTTAEARDIEFSINGVKHAVSHKFRPDTTLNDYLRDVAGLKGTKNMCKEAGCGCCAVTVTHSSCGNKAETMSINSCLCPLYSVDGWQISTIEGIGSHKEGLHPIQKRLADYNGTQCGYCSPGFVMSMYGLLHQQPNATQQEIEDSFDGHICRCTGYRPILEAMKTFGSDAAAGEKGLDIEDLNKKLCPKTGEVCKSKDKNNRDNGTLPRTLNININGTKWYRPVNLKELTKFMNDHKTHSVKLVYGNTSSGIFKHEPLCEVYIDLRAVSELHVYEEKSSGLVIGMGTTLTQLKEYLKKLQNKPGYHYCERVVKHLKVVASVLVRNAGSIAGNFMIKHAHNSFPSDLFTIMEAVGAKVDVLDTKTNKKTSKVSLVDWLKMDMKHKVLLFIEMPKWNPIDHYRSFKITPRWQNAHAYVNAAFKIPNKDKKIIAKPNIIFGGIDGKTIHAVKTEAFLNGKTLNDSVIHESLEIVHNELNPEEDPLIATPKYRKDLATNLLYKTLLEVYKASKYSIQSGADSFERPISSGMFSFQEKPEEFPMKEPLPKKTATFQTAGEAQYISDMPTFQHELAGAFVTSTIACGTLKDVDTTEALSIPGVIKFIGAKDLPPNFVNNYIGFSPMFPGLSAELFITKDIQYEGQPIGIILAETNALAEEGARKVKINYETVKKPIMNLKDAIEENSVFDPPMIQKADKGDIEAGLKECKYIVAGEVEMGTQYHFFLESQVALTVPSEDGIDVYTAHQWGDWCQTSVAQVIGKPKNYCNTITPRLGGSFGGKMLTASHTACAAAVCTELTERPVRIIMDLSTSMKRTEKRFPLIAKYRAGCDSNGKMQAIDVDIYIDSGSVPSPFLFEILHSSDQVYHVPNWKVSNIYMKTNKSMSGACRAPGAVPGMLISETIIEHVAKEYGKHPILFKELNLYETGQTAMSQAPIVYCSLKDMWKRLKQVAEVEARMADTERFNKNNQWRKRGITICGNKYGMNYWPGGTPTSVSIFNGDGTVTVNTAGVEMGQGLHMKVAQAVAKTLKVPLESVKVRPNNYNFAPNAVSTGSSTTSERCVRSAIAACEKINEGLNPLKEKMSGAPMTQILTAAAMSNVPLFALVDGDTPVEGFHKYFTYMLAVNETEVDVLTGEFQVKRVDMMADFGESLSPNIDRGQVEGAYIMGLGAYLTEDILYEKKFGRMLNDGTWEYKPPTTKDIPIDWRIHFLPDNPNTAGVLGSKATGEPPSGLSVGAMMAIKASIEEVREQLHGRKEFMNIYVPFTVERIQQAANVQVQDLKV